MRLKLIQDPLRSSISKYLINKNISFVLFSAIPKNARSLGRRGYVHSMKLKNIFNEKKKSFIKKEKILFINDFLSPPLWSMF
jgi:hypothetical protein